MQPYPLLLQLLLMPVLLAAYLVQTVFSGASFVGEIKAAQGAIAQSEGYNEAARRAYRTANRIYPHRSDWVYSEGTLTRAVAGNVVAIPLLDHAVTGEPNGITLLIADAETHAMLGHTDRATALLDRVEALTPWAWETFDIRGVVALTEKRPEDAVAQFTRAYELAWKAPPSLLNQLALAHYRSGTYKEALRWADRALKAQPHAPEHHLVRGRILLDMNRASEAALAFDTSAKAYVQQLRQARPVEQRLYEAERYRAASWATMGTYDAALFALATLSKTSPENAYLEAGRVMASALLKTPALVASGEEYADGVYAWTADALIDADEVGTAQTVLNLARNRPDGVADPALSIVEARLLTATGEPAQALSKLGALGPAQRNSAVYATALAEASAAAGRPATARLEYESLRGRPDLPANLRRRIDSGLAAFADQ